MGKSKAINITVDDRLPRTHLTNFVELQGELKGMSTENYDKLRKSILKKGFFAPVYVWLENTKDKRPKILDGHQRIRVLRKMADEGHEVGPVPYLPIVADSEKDAREKLLLLVSQYGKVDDDGLYKFLVESDIDPALLVSDFAIPKVELDPQSFLDNFVNPTPTPPPAPADNSPPPAEHGRSASDGVKMMQLFFAEEDYEKVVAMIEKMKPKYGTTNATDTIRAALKEVSEEKAPDYGDEG